MKVTNLNKITQQGTSLPCAPNFPMVNNLTVTKTDEVEVSYRLMLSSATNFVGRVDYLFKLEEILTAGSSKNDSRPVAVLCAMGGMGKSQIGIKFAETRRHL